MTTWNGWQADFLAAASLTNTANHRNFLTDWAANATAPSCNNNPIDLTHHEPGSSNCHATGLVGVSIQRYSSHTWARTAFNSELHNGKYPALLAALKSANPYNVGDPGAVATDLASWGSVHFGQVYLAATQGTGGGGAGTTHATKAWADLQKQVNHGLPTALATIGRLNRQTANSLARRSRVHR